MIFSKFLVYFDSPFLKSVVWIIKICQFIWPLDPTENRPNPRTATPDKKGPFPLVIMVIVAGEYDLF